MKDRRRYLVLGGVSTRKHPEADPQSPAYQEFSDWRPGAVVDQFPSWCPLDEWLVRQNLALTGSSRMAKPDDCLKETLFVEEDTGSCFRWDGHKWELGKLIPRKANHDLLALVPSVRGGDFLTGRAMREVLQAEEELTNG